MGNDVLNITLSSCNSSVVRAYAHAGLPPSPYLPAVVAKAVNPIGMVLINLSPSSAAIRIGTSPEQSYTAWALTPGSAGIFGHQTVLNGQLLPPSIEDGRSIEDIPVPGVVGSSSTPLTLPAVSVTFLATDVASASLWI